MDNLIKGSTLLELHAWLDADDDQPGWDILTGSPFSHPLSAVQNYFAEYHLEYFRQRYFNHFPSRLHALILFATRVDAHIFEQKRPDLVFGKHRVCAHSRGAYACSFHDASWFDYLRLPHSLGFSALDEVAGHYWAGRTVEEVGLSFMNEPWREPPVIEALFQGKLEQVTVHPHSGWLPGFA